MWLRATCGMQQIRSFTSSRSANRPTTSNSHATRCAYRLQYRVEHANFLLRLLDRLAALTDFLPMRFLPYSTSLCWLLGGVATLWQVKKGDTGNVACKQKPLTKLSELPAMTTGNNEQNKR